MEEREWITGEWGVSENNRKARYYKLTARGRQQLRQDAANWERYSIALTRLLKMA
jgi:DNA-binding PadR family transcriptional regulator